MHAAASLVFLVLACLERGLALDLGVDLLNHADEDGAHVEAKNVGYSEADKGVVFLVPPHEREQSVGEKGPELVGADKSMD